MRLKFLFFPIIFIISLSIFIGYIWPEISNVENINKEKITNAEALKAIKDKQAAIVLIGTQITDDSDGKKATVDNYLPDKKVEERIISGINYLTADSGVSLVNISLKSLEPVNSTNETQQKATSVVGVLTGAANSTSNPTTAAAIPSNNSANDQVSLNNADELQFSEATISVSGDYEKIKLFIDQLQKMSLFNNIKSLTISNQEKDSTNLKDGEKNNSSNLSAGIVVDFGYLHFLGLNNNKIINFQPALDNNTIDVLKQYISQKTNSINSMVVNAGEKGKANPFLP